MKITNSEVKTIYTIDIQLKDFANIFSAAKSDEWKPEAAFKEFDLTDTTIGNINTCFKGLREADSIKYIVDKLGFDGVENYGYYNKRKGVYTMAVYDRGDMMNGNYNTQR
jgi:hypothetical protein